MRKNRSLERVALWGLVEENVALLDVMNDEAQTEGLDQEGEIIVLGLLETLKGICEEIVE